MDAIIWWKANFSHLNLKYSSFYPGASSWKVCIMKTYTSWLYYQLFMTVWQSFKRQSHSDNCLFQYLWFTKSSLLRFFFPLKVSQYISQPAESESKESILRSSPLEASHPSLLIGAVFTPASACRSTEQRSAVFTSGSDPENTERKKRIFVVRKDVNCIMFTTSVKTVN